MKPLTLDDLLPLQDHLAQRQELFDAHCRYVERYRRVRIGPFATVIFENRQTLWFRLQEIIRIARMSNPAQLQQMLDVYNPLLPRKNCLQAGLLLELAGENPLLDEMEPWQNLRGEHVRLCIDKWEYPAELITSRPEDRCFGTAHWIQFHLDDVGKALLKDRRQEVLLSLEMSDEVQHRVLLRSHVRQSLLDDLQISDRDAA